MLLDLVKTVFAEAKRRNDTALIKWLYLESQAVVHAALGSGVLVLLALSEHLKPPLACTGGVIGAAIFLVYVFVLLRKELHASVAAIGVAAMAAVTAHLYSDQPLWVIVSNGLGASLLVLGLIAMWTRRITD